MSFIQKTITFCLLLQQVQSIEALEEPKQMQMMMLLQEQEQPVLPLVLALGCQRKQLLQPLRMLLQERSFSFYYLIFRATRFLCPEPSLIHALSPIYAKR
jgi:hypothetical protein